MQSRGLGAHAAKQSGTQNRQRNDSTDGRFWWLVIVLTAITMAVALVMEQVM